MTRAMEKITAIADKAGLVMVASFAQRVGAGVFVRLRVTAPAETSDTAVMVYHCLAELMRIRRELLAKFGPPLQRP